ncbi:MAG TPA: peptidylprolyl isomerase [Pseudomonadales bacterium]|jgi:peptidyl-prolyl cis-trans isomerase SurA|nr:peptidylprolyl isomerase [Pseudomonadales bacterium]HNN86067.1 peptidylprolyl isomerase [Pseudomonadales bacterium]
MKNILSACRAFAFALLASTGLGLTYSTHAEPPTQQTLDKVVAVVNDDVIMASELALQTRMLAAQLHQAGQQMPPTNVLQTQVLEKLIVESLQLQIGERSGIKVSKEQLDAAVASVAAQNKLSTDVFRKELNAQGIPFGMFRENIRRQIILQQVQQAFVIKRIEVSDQDIDNFLASEEGRQLAMQAAIDKPINQTHARHILIKPSAIRNDEETRAVLEKIRNVVQQGGDFSALAKKYSEDPGSALKGGELGWVSTGQVVPEFEAAMNNTPTGSVSEPFQTQFGWHVVQVLDRRAQNMSEAILRQQAQMLLRKRKFQDELPRWLKELRDQAYVKINS